LPGVGRNTAGAILAYAFNKPAVFIETNIRTVYIHHFFADRNDVADAEIAAVLNRTMDRSNPRVFYWQLMDYGSYLKQTIGNTARASKTYSRQSKFYGSLRQIRGEVLRQLSTGPKQSAALDRHVRDDRLSAVLDSLVREGLIVRLKSGYRLP